MRKSIIFSLLVFSTFSAYSQSLGLTVHQGANMKIIGGQNNSTGKVDSSNAIVVRVLGDVTLGEAADQNVSNFKMSDKAELIIDGNLIRNAKNKSTFDESDVVFRIDNKDQKIIGGFEDTNAIYNILTTKGINRRLEIHNNVAVKQNVILSNNGYVLTSPGSSFDDGNLYPAKLTLLNSSTDALKNFTTISGDKNKIVEGKLEWNTIAGAEYLFPISVDRNNPEVGGAQLVKFKSNQGNGLVLASFTKNTGGNEIVDLLDPNCANVSIRDVINHGWWNLDHNSNTISNFNVAVQPFNINISDFTSQYTLVKKESTAPIANYLLEGVDPNNCSGFAITGFIERNNYTKFSDFGIAPLGQNITTAIPNVITPNGDGVNDYWNLRFIKKEYPNLKVQVYNRWGNLVYRSEGVYNNDWAGTHYRGENLPDGVYYYILELEPKYDKTKTGFIQIVRD